MMIATQGQQLFQVMNGRCQVYEFIQRLSCGVVLQNMADRSIFCISEADAAGFCETPQIAWSNHVRTLRNTIANLVARQITHRQEMYRLQNGIDHLQSEIEMLVDTHRVEE